MLFFRYHRTIFSVVNALVRTLTRYSYSFFKTLIDHEVTVELKNDIQLKGILKSVDQYLNIKLDDIQVVEELKYPHLVCRLYPYPGRCERNLISDLGIIISQSSVKNVFIRGSVVRYVHLPGASVDTQLLEDATRRGTLRFQRKSYYILTRVLQKLQLSKPRRNEQFKVMDERQDKLFRS